MYVHCIECMIEWLNASAYDLIFQVLFRSHCWWSTRVQSWLPIDDSSKSFHFSEVKLNLCLTSPRIVPWEKIACDSVLLGTSCHTGYMLGICSIIGLYQGVQWSTGRVKSL